MIARLQKNRLIARVLLEKMRDGEFPTAEAALAAAAEALEGLRYGAPLTRMRPAVPGRPIGGPTGKDIQASFTELEDDLALLFTALVQLGGQALDLYDVFSVRRDALSLRMDDLRIQVGTLLAMVSAGSQATIYDGFHDLKLTDLDRTTASVDLDEGTVSLPPDSQNSVRYDGSRVKVVRTKLPPGAIHTGPEFKTVFTPYRVDAWYAQLPAGSEYVAYANVTGANYEKGATAEVEINALRIEPTCPLQVGVEWSPDGFNWHALAPAVGEVIRDRTTFHFEPVSLGYLRFSVRPAEAGGPVVTPSGGDRVTSATEALRLLPVGIKRIELFRKGYTTDAEFYSVKHELPYPVHTVVAELDRSVPSGTRLDAYVSQDPNGPWVDLGPGPVVFDNLLSKELPLTDWEKEGTDTAPSMFWTAALPASDRPLPETGELWAGIERIELSAFPFDWRLRRDRAHVPLLEDWTNPLGIVRTGVFRSLGEWGTPEIDNTSFADAGNPFAEDNQDPQQPYLTLAIVGPDGKFSLQPGYNYRFRARLWCPAPVTLEEQRIGVVNPVTGGAGQVLAPFSVYLNGKKAYEQTKTVEDVTALTASYRMVLPLQQGWNDFQLLVQLPSDLPDLLGTAGVAAEGITLYFQPNLFGDSRASDLGIDRVAAYDQPWKRLSEFDLRYNTPLTRTDVWAWRLRDDGAADAALFNHNPLNEDGTGAAAVTLDGVNMGRNDSFALRYAVEGSADNRRQLYFRAELSRDAAAPAPPVLRSYRLIVN